MGRGWKVSSSRTREILIESLPWKRAFEFVLAFGILEA